MSFTGAIISSETFFGCITTALPATCWFANGYVPTALLMIVPPGSTTKRAKKLSSPTLPLDSTLCASAPSCPTRPMIGIMPPSVFATIPPFRMIGET
ncbi:hypothetical protein [Burkholderia sp. CCA53]|uniref:hypothetical protein n=1 Tax=Burkholderia sp. CCA53 TaxID=1776288 RepID=UPI0020C76025|nr:hypothetical protein [Burkholderia sp. CCA53]